MSITILQVTYNIWALLQKELFLVSNVEMNHKSFSPIKIIQLGFTLLLIFWLKFDHYSLCNRALELGWGHILSRVSITDQLGRLINSSIQYFYWLSIRTQFHENASARKVLNTGNFLWTAKRVTYVTTVSTTLRTNCWSKGKVHRVHLNIYNSVNINF